MSFCGSRQGSLSVEGGVLQNRCFVDVMNIVPCGLFLLVSVTILVVWKQSVLGKLKAKTWVHFHCHIIRWILMLLLILVSCLEIAEGFVSDYLDPDQPNYHVVVPHCISLLASIVAVIFYHNVEMWNSPRFLLVLLPYWCSAGVLKLVKAFSLYHTEINVSHLRLWLTWFDTFIYATLLIVELKVLFTQRYAFFKKPRNVKPPEELANTRYYASYANFLSRATFWWMNSVLIQGYKSPPTSEKLGKLPKSERALTNYRLLLRAFEDERAKAESNGNEPSLHKIYLRAFWPMLVVAGFFRLFGDLLAFIGPWCIEVVVDYAYREIELKKYGLGHQTAAGSSAVTYSPLPTGNGSDITLSADTDAVAKDYYVTVGTFLSNGFGLCVILFVCTLIQHTLLQNHHYLVIRQGVRLRSALQTMIYSKALKLSSLTITSGKQTVGQIMNHMTMDSSFLMWLFFFIHYIWATPVQVIIALILMYFKLGISALLGGLLIVLAAPVQIFVGRGMSQMQKKVMQQADQRVKQCNELIQGIKVIKLLAWESFQAKTITDIRKKEITLLFKLAGFRAMFTFVGTAIPALATMLTFVLYPHIEDKPLTAGKALSTLALFNILAIPLVLFTLFTTSLITARVSAKRLIPYFLESEVEGMDAHAGTMQADGTLDNDLEMIEMHHMNNKKSFSLARDELGGSSCSLSSHKSHSLSPAHSRQNSTTSLLEIGVEHPAATAAALSVGTDHPLRHRHHSGMSEDEDDVNKDQNYVIEVKDGNFSWDLGKQELCLKNINIAVPQGKLVIIVGAVGSGKSSLLSAILGEMLTVSGKVHWTRNPGIAYVAQKPWLLNKTLRDNILFGQAMIWKRYQKVIESCALQPDIDMLPAGDSTEIGEKGVNLSGGQKQRVSIARALYSHADVFILDDPLSALDAHVGRHVFDEVILRKLIKRKKTVILVTHQLQYLNYAHSVLVMKDGEVQYQGRLSEVKKVNPELYESWRIALKEAKVAEVTSRKASEGVSDGTIDHMPSRQVSEESQSSIKEITRRYPRGASLPNVRMHKVEQNGIDSEGEIPEEEGENEEKSKEEDKDASGKLIKKEHQEVGAVRFRIYLYHLRACGIPLILLVLFLLIVCYGLTVGTNFWISIWTSQSTIFTDTQPANSTERFDNDPYVHKYVVLSLSAVVVTMLSGFTLQFTGIRGAKNLHSHMLKKILRVPMRFFDTNPSGRILNRFSSDIGQIDQKLPGTWDAFLRCSFATVAAVLVNCIGTPFFIFAAVPLAILYYCLQRFYRATSRELQRLDKVTLSPIFSHFSETLNGLQTIRAYGVQARFRQHALKTIDDNVLPFLYNQTANRWLGVRLDYMGAILVFAAATASLSAGLAGQTDPAFIGLCIAYALMVSNYLNWIVRNTTDLELNMNAVERVDEYTKLETETTVAECLHHEVGWPTQGKIEFRNVSLSYDESAEPVVNCVSFTIEPGEKIGICGRTGSGKSSLTLSLFRLIKISDGEILIDNKNISHVALPELRSKLAIIPQDPILFTGSIRYNLDPAGEIADDKIWTALESVQLKETIKSLPEQLGTSVSEGGENFSIGQKQLFCLARAFLRENKVLVLDEATASIDLETDNKLQQVIGSVFKDKTVITIAHRISSIMKYDRVMVMESGEVLEFDSPEELMKKQDGHFASLVNQSCVAGPNK